MRIGFVSYEMPPATGGGGIGTYLANVTQMLSRAGHVVEVFAAAGRGPEGSKLENGILVHRLGRDVPSYLAMVGEVVARRHAEEPLDVVEAPEFFAQARPVQNEVPDLPVVVKLHTPVFAVDRYSYMPFSRAMRFRRAIGSLARLQLPAPPPGPPAYNAETDPECEAARKADQISSPSRAIWELLQKEWGLDPARRFDVVLPFQPAEALLALPIERETRAILFLGRLEGRKGIVELARALPRVLRERPDVTMRFVGQSHAAPDGRGTFSDWIRRQLGRFSNQIELIGAVPPERLSEVFGGADVAVFPSRWESFGYVCLEAMAAGCGVVASRHGGMAEILDGGRCGILVDPFDPGELATGLLRAISDRQQRQEMAARARERTLAVYSPDRLIARYEEGYRLAIRSHHQRGAVCVN